MINRILVCLDKSPYTDSSISYANWLALHHDAAVEGMVVIDTEGIERSIGAVPIGQMRMAKTRIATKEEESHQLMESILKKFKERCEADGVRHTEYEDQGTPADAILAESNYFDCVVIGLRTFFTYESGSGRDHMYGTDDDNHGNSLDLILDQSLAPVFAVPLEWKPAEGAFDVLIAIDNSVNSMRCLRQFARLYGRAPANVTLLNCHTNETEAKDLLGKSEGFLKAHGFEKITLDWQPRKPREVITYEFVKPYDLICVGAHAKTAVIDYFVGSVTKDLIQLGRKPLLIANG